MRAYISYLSLTNWLLCWTGWSVTESRTRSPQERTSFYSNDLNEWTWPSGTS